MAVALLGAILWEERRADYQIRRAFLEAGLGAHARAGEARAPRDGADRVRRRGVRRRDGYGGEARRGFARGARDRGPGDLDDLHGAAGNQLGGGGAGGTCDGTRRRARGRGGGMGGPGDRRAVHERGGRRAMDFSGGGDPPCDSRCGGGGRVVTLLRIAALFELFDGLQVVATGALRGIGDTRSPMLSALDRLLGDRDAGGLRPVLFRWDGVRAESGSG